MSYYKQAEDLAEKAARAFDKNNPKEALTLYTKAISLFIDKYKEDKDYERRAKYTIIISGHLSMAENIKKIIKLPSVPKMLSPIQEEELDTIKLA